MNNTSPTAEERIWSVLAHLSALTLGMGILLPVIGWSEQRQKSRYISFQCMQALGYQSLGYTVWLLSYILVVILLAVFPIFFAGSNPGDGRIFQIWLAIFMVVVLAAFGVYFVLPMIAAVATALGKEFRYPIMGNRLANYLGYGPTMEMDPALSEQHEDRWVAAMGHFSVILPIWGILVPFVAWVLQGKRNPFLRFQTIQTLIYQGFTNLLYFGSMFVMMIAFIPMAMLATLNGSYGSENIVAVGFLFVTLAIAMLILLVLPLFHILGQWAGYRVLKGNDYHYPVLGTLVEQRIAKGTLVSSAQEQAPVLQTLNKDKPS